MRNIRTLSIKYTQTPKIIDRLLNGHLYLMPRGILFEAPVAKSIK